MRIDFPTNFEVNYPEDNKNYYGETFKKDLEKVLLRASDYYCMYCGRRILLDNEYYFNLEHSIEKDGYLGIEKPKTPFKNCKFNLSITCIKCNQKYKNKMINRVPYNMVNKELNCLSKCCSEPCQEYIQTKNEYLKRNKIILQPSGVKNDKGKFFRIQYDLIKQIYVPNLQEEMSTEEINFIQEHIARFNLNRSTSSTCIMEVCELLWKIIDIITETFTVKKVLEIAKEVHFNNVIAKLFLRFVEQNIHDISMLKDFCELYMILSFI